MLAGGQTSDFILIGALVASLLALVVSLISLIKVINMENELKRSRKKSRRRK
ncbi:hypothetical protein [Vagococcus humatus]|uniref:hypothetical protein n=1 Tax=Vagococcus humatus TaxID=1889241 RepID=UPI0014038D0A|nr:hypothetical protein [Vagococcus humatus]